MEEGEGDEDEDGDEGEEGGGDEELEDALLRAAEGRTTISSGKLLLHSSSSWGSTRRVTSFPVQTPKGEDHKKKKTQVRHIYYRREGEKKKTHTNKKGA